jgi:hypothetical protein
MWWYRSTTRPPFDDKPTDETMAVIHLYWKQRGQGLSVGDDFRKNLLQCLQDLNRPVRISPREESFWTITAYELAKGINPKTLCKQMRELERIAARLFPDRAPQHKRRETVSEDEKQAIRGKYSAQLSAEGFATVQPIADEFECTPACVGRICRDIRMAAEALRKQTESVDSKEVTF